MLVMLTVQKLLNCKNNREWLILLTHDDFVFQSGQLIRRDSIPRIRNYAEIVVPKYSLIDFKSHFRLERSSFDIICRAIGRQLSVHRGNLPVTVEKQMLIFLSNHIKTLMINNCSVTECEIHQCILQCTRELSGQSRETY